MKMSLQTQTKEKTIKSAFDEFILVKQNENLSNETIYDYSRNFPIFMKFCGEDTLCSSVTDDTIQGYIAYLRSKPKKQNNPDNKEIKYLASATIASYVRHLRAVLYFFMERGYTKKFTIRVPKFDKEIKEVYTQYELEKLLKKPDLKKCSFSEYRNWVMTNYLLSTANRISTAINIKIQDLNFEEDEILLRKLKGRRQYIIPMQQDLKKILIEYLSYRKGEPEDYLFCNENDDKKPLSRDGAITNIGRYNERRGVIKTSVHLYRNTFAKFWIINGGDIIRLQKILGHKKIDMVLEYVDMYGKDLQKNFNNFNPLSAFSKGEHISLKKS